MKSAQAKGLTIRWVWMKWDLVNGLGTESLRRQTARAINAAQTCKCGATMEDPANTVVILDTCCSDGGEEGAGNALSQHVKGAGVTWSPVLPPETTLPEVDHLTQCTCPSAARRRRPFKLDSLDTSVFATGDTVRGAELIDEIGAEDEQCLEIHSCHNSSRISSRCIV